jgi:hypothetical protein
MAAKLWLIGGGILVLFTGAFITLYKLKLISKAIFFIFLFFLFVAGLIGLFLKFQSLSKKGAIIGEKRNSFKDIFEKINNELNDMPDSEVLLWERGKDISTSTKDFLDNNGKNNRFIAIQAITKHSRQRVVVYYNVTEGIIWDWRSNPAPTTLSEPFYNFEPYQKKMTLGSPQDYLRQKVKARKTGLVVMPSDIEEETDTDRFVSDLKI